MFSWLVLQDAACPMISIQLCNSLSLQSLFSSRLEPKLEPWRSCCFVPVSLCLLNFHLRLLTSLLSLSMSAFSSSSLVLTLSCRLAFNIHVRQRVWNTSICSSFKFAACFADVLKSHNYPSPLPYSIFIMSSSPPYFERVAPKYVNFSTSSSAWPIVVILLFPFCIHSHDFTFFRVHLKTSPCCILW